MKMMLRAGALGALAMVALSQPATAATTISVDISGATNITTASYTNGGNYPTAGSTVSVNGVDFKLAGTSGYAGLVQTSFGGTPSSVTFATQPIMATSFYTLAATTYGLSTGVEAGKFIFTFADNSSFSYSLVSGVNVRDHFGNRPISNAFGTADFGGGVTFDVQKIDLPMEFWTKSLASLTVLNTVPAGTADNTGGQPLLAALSFVSPSAVPESGTWAMMIVGFGVTGGMLRRRRHTVGTPALA